MDHPAGGRVGRQAEHPKQTRDVVVRALADADELIRTNGATSAVDRIHTALHGHILALCEDAGLEIDRETTTNRALKLLRQSHPALAASGPRAEDITRILGAMATVLDSLNPIRNNASVAHPNTDLLDHAEAHLAINTARTVFAFLSAKLGATRRTTPPTRRRPSARTAQEGRTPRASRHPVPGTLPRTSTLRTRPCSASRRARRRSE